MSRVVVTGINGFVGKHLARELHARGHGVIGLGQDTTVDAQLETIVTDYTACDLTKSEQVAKLKLDNVTAVINLAGLAKVGASFDNPELYQRVNMDVLTILGERLLSKHPAVRLIAVSTGAVYDTDQTMPLTEDSRLIIDGSPYAMSKLAMERAALDLRRRGLDCVIVRPFNHLGPGQAGGFLLPDLYQKIRQAGQGGTLPVGDLTTKRDYTDVRDVVRAYADLALADQLDETVYNVCSGQSVTGQALLDLLLETMDLTGKLEVHPDPALVRPNDPKDLFGSHQRLSNQTGWQPQIALKQTVADYVSSR